MSFSIITPSCGKRPRALALAIRSVLVAWDHVRATGEGCDIEMLIGFDGITPEDFIAPHFVRAVTFPFQGCFGNPIRNALIKTAKGRFLIFLDDDNALTPQAFTAFFGAMNADVIIGRIDTHRAFAEPFLPRPSTGGERIVPGNIDPLCIAVRTEFVRTQGKGWQNEGGYESDYLNILRYVPRARLVTYIDDIVGVYDAGRGLDPQGTNARQGRLPIPLPWSIHG